MLSREVYYSRITFALEKKNFNCLEVCCEISQLPRLEINNFEVDLDKEGSKCGNFNEIH